MADTRCVERVELNLSASGLPKLDTFRYYIMRIRALLWMLSSAVLFHLFSNTDAFAVVFLRNSDRTTRMLGHTVRVRRDL